MRNTRVLGIAKLFTIMMLVIVFFLIDRMVIHRDKYFSSSYTDKAFVDLVTKMIDEKAIYIAGDRIAVDETKLREKIRKETNRARIRQNLPLMSIKNGRIIFDSKIVSITNNRPNSSNLILRGRFLDRNGQILAESTIDERTWRKERTYHFGPEFFHIIGHDSRVFGKRFLENELDDYLEGQLHTTVYRKTDDPFKKLQIGDDVTLTMDASLQRRAQTLLGTMRGAVIVLDIKSGEIIIAVSAPSFDPNTSKKTIWDDAVNDRQGKPFENRAFSMLYPPGSTFKTVVASAWIEKRPKSYVNKELKVQCNGNKNWLDISDIHAHGTVTLTKAYSESCNQFFSEAGVATGLPLLEYSNRFGFNHEWNLLPQIKNHDFTTALSRAFVWDKQKVNKPFDNRDFSRNPKLIAQCSIGHNLIMATPLQMALVAATVANKGVLMPPYIVKEIVSANGKSVVTAPSVVGIKVLNDTTAAKMQEMMEMVMLSGTGKDVKKIFKGEGRITTQPKDNNGRIVKVAGKTGTAEIGTAEKEAHSWFIGYAPADTPRFAIAVIAENQGFGSATAAPIAVDLLAETLNSLNK